MRKNELIKVLCEQGLAHILKDFKESKFSAVNIDQSDFQNKEKDMLSNKCQPIENNMEKFSQPSPKVDFPQIKPI